MSRSLLVGLDLGGGGGRCLVVDVDSGSATAAFRPWSFRSVPEIPMASELDIPRTWAVLGEGVAEALARAGRQPEDVAGIAATAVRLGSVVLDAGGRELLAASNRDARALSEALALAGRGPEIHALTGHWPNPVQPLPRLQWLARHAPELWECAAHFLSLSDWLAFRLCGEIAGEPTQAGASGCFALATRAWAWDWIDELGLPRRLFPDVREPGTALGRLTPEAAAALGLRAGVPVAVGGGDTQCGLLGLGVLSPGGLGAIAGTTAPVQRVADRPTRDTEGRLWSGHHVRPGTWVVESNGGGAGEALTWIAELLYPEAPAPVLALLAEAAASSPGGAGMLSTLGADVMDARQLGLPLGNLTLSHVAAADDPSRRRHLARGIVEGIAFALRGNVEQTDAACGDAPPALPLAGGLSRSAFFGQLAADVLGRRVEVGGVSEATALGAAVCAGVGAGLFRDLGEGAERLARTARVHEPDPERAAAYAELYAGWCRLREARRASDAVAGALTLRALSGAAATARPAPTTAFRPRILVTAELDEHGLAALSEIGDVEYAPFKQKMRLLSGRGLADALAGVHVLVTEVDVVDGPALAEAGDLRVVAACRGDAVNVDVDACTELGIPVVNTPGRNADAVADLALAFLLMLARMLPEATAFLREPGGQAGDMGRMGRAFGTLQGRELWRKTVGLVGLGAVGRKVVARLRPFGARCLVFDPFLDDDAVRRAGAESASFETLLAESDFVSLHAAVTDASRGLLGAPELARMKPGAFLVNTARAALVDQDALVDALRAGHLGGAALDVFAVEPPASDDPLLALPNVIATPHVGGNTADVAAHQGAIVADELRRLRAGEAPRHLLNPDSLARFRWNAPRPAPDEALVQRLRRKSGVAVTDLQKESKRGRPARRSEPPVPPAPPREDAAPAPADAGPLRERMETLLQEFVRRIADDEALRASARGEDVTLHFALSDLGLEFYFGLADGSVTAALGTPPSPAPVELKLSADLLDGMFTGRRNPMQAAMQGELSFSGDTAKAMTLTRIQGDLERLYREAREEVGDPGDLAALSAPREVADPRAELVGIVQELYAQNLVTATGGNVSVRAPDAPDTAWITPSQSFKGDLRPEHLVRVDLSGRALDADAASPSSEAAMHSAVLRARPDVQCVIHCHAPNATVLANTGLPFLPISTEAAFLVNIGRIPFVMPGTDELARTVVEALGDGWAVLMQNHGLLVAGRSLRRAADMAEIVERTAQVILGCYAVGREPPVLPAETVELLARYGDLMA